MAGQADGLSMIAAVLTASRSDTALINVR